MIPRFLLLTVALCAVSVAEAQSETKVEAWLKAMRQRFDQPLSQADEALQWLKPQGVTLPKTDKAYAAKMKKLIAAQQSETIRSLELPIHWPTLKHHGFVNIGRQEVFPFKAGQRFYNLRGNYHSYSYRQGAVQVLSRRLELRDQLLIHGLLRALELIRFRYPKVHRALFRLDAGASKQSLQTQIQSAQKRAGRSISWFNTTERIVFLLDSHGPQAFESVYLLGPKRSFKLATGQSLKVYKNSIVIRVNVSRLARMGSQLVYPQRSARDAFLLNLRDAIVESLVHEGLHCLISRDRVHRKRLADIRNHHKVGQPGGYGLDGKSVEEAVVSLTSIAFFEAKSRKKTGLHPDVLKFYGRTLFENMYKPKLLALNKRTAGDLFKRLGVKDKKALKDALVLRGIFEG